MTHDEFQNILEDQITRLRDILDVKGDEYSTEDQLHNFIVAGQLQGCSPKEALVGMMTKHIVSVYDMTRSNEELIFARWDEKITDAIAYLVLLRAAVLEEIQTLEGA